MPYKARSESMELQILRILDTRSSLSDKDKQHYLNLKKGYEGEVQFDSLTEKLTCECIILNDLLLKLNNTVFQIDSLIIVSETLYFCEVKNFKGDYFYESSRLYKKPKTEIINPLNQLSRNETLLRQLLQNSGYNIPISAFVIFINPEFTLYQAPLNQPFLLPTQLNHFVKLLNSNVSTLSQKHKTLADKLISLHLNDSPYRLLPTYHYSQLQKGIICTNCASFIISIERQKCVCHDCGHEEVAADAVLRSVEELKLLFPEQKITTNLVYEWCKGLLSKKRIRSILETKYTKAGVHQWSYYV